MKQLKINDLTNKTDEGTTIINQAPEQPQADEISLRAIEQLFDPKNLKSNSRLKFDQVAIITKLHLFGDVFGIKFPKNLADLILELQISTNGLGRKELVQLVQRRDGLFDQIQQPIKTSKDIFR